MRLVLCQSTSAVASAAGATESGLHDRMATILRELPQLLPADDDVQLANTLGSISKPLVLFLRQEMRVRVLVAFAALFFEPRPCGVQLLNVVLRTVTASLTAVDAALKGVGPMTEQCAQVITSLAQARVPRAWTLGEVILQNLGQWMTMVQQQEAQLRRWATVNQPSVFWLPGFFNPKVCLLCSRPWYAGGRMARLWMCAGFPGCGATGSVSGLANQ